MSLELPSLRHFPPADRADYARIFDLAPSFRTDETVEHVVDEWARRAWSQRHRRARRAAPSPTQMILLSATPTPLSLAAQFRALFRSDPVGIADVWIDASNTSIVSGKTYGMIDRVDTSHWFMQTATGTQAPPPAADAGIGGALAVTFAAGSWYDSTRASAAWRRYTDGTGSEVTTVMTPTDMQTGTIVGTSDLATVASVAYYSFLTGGGAFAVGVYNGSTVSRQQTTGSYAPNVPTYFTDAWLSPTAEHFQKETPLTGSSTAVTPSTANPNYTFRLGAGMPTGGYRLFARWRASYFFHRRLTTAERAVRRAFIQADTLIAA